MTTNAQAPTDLGPHTSPPSSGSRRFVWLLAAAFLLLLSCGGSVGGVVWWRLHSPNSTDENGGTTDPVKSPPLETCNDETDPKYLKNLEFGEPLNTPFDRSYLDALANRDIPEIERYSWQPKELVAVLGEHRMRGNVFATSPDGKLLAVGATYHGYLRIGKLDTLHETVVFASPAATTALAWSPDGATLAVLGGDNRVRLYDVRDLDKIPEPLVLQERGTLSFSLAYSGDGNYLLTCCTLAQSDPNLPLLGSASVWDVKAKTPKIVKELSHIGPVRYVAFSPVPGDYRALTAGGPGDGQLHLWAALDGKEIGTIDFRVKDPTNDLKKDKVTYVGEVAFSPDGKQALSAHHHPTNPTQVPSTVRLWDLEHFEKGHELQILDGHVPGTAALAFSPDGKHVATGRLTDGSVALWDIRKEKGRAELRRVATTGALYELRFVGDRLLYAGTISNDYNIHVHDVATGKELSPPRGHLAAVSCVAAAPDGRLVASTSIDYYLRLWDLKTVDQRFAIGVGQPWAVGFHPDAKRVYYYGPGYASLPFVDVEKGEVRTPTYAAAQSGALYTAAITRDGRYAITGGYQDATVRMWRLSDGVQVRYFDLKPEPPAQGVTVTTALSPDMIRAVATCGGKTYLLHLRCQERKPNWNAVPWPVFLPDARVAFFGGPTTPVWAVKDAVKESEPLKLNLGGTTGPQLSADGRRVAATTGARALVYDVASGRLLWEWTPPPHFAGMGGVALSPDGQHLVTANGDGTVYVIRIP